MFGNLAFWNRVSLESMDLPAAQTIGDHAFSGCDNLTSVDLPATPPSIYMPFSGTGSSGTITVSVPTGAVSAYTSA
ncbi:MAG: leucine-rich repeat domain-containing protein [Treponema sp.]|nr:leucine-rich repeat domain-containing protein [Treponema sp.]